MNRALANIQSIDTSAWTDDDKSDFLSTLRNLKTAIDNYLAAQPSSIDSLGV
ncbi:MAG: hypothetical protein AB7S77_21065 [Desulfatirhabdiaceae bacterium]